MEQFKCRCGNGYPTRENLQVHIMLMYDPKNHQEIPVEQGVQ